MSTETAQPTAENYLVELLTRTQRQHLIAMDGPDEEPAKARVLRASVIVSQFSAAWFLSWLLKVDPVAAEIAVEDLRGVLDDGGSVGEFTWDMLSTRGIDPATIKPVPEPGAGEPACGRCKQPFTATDNRVGWGARSGDSPWCKGCVDRCHESTDAFHSCVICESAAEQAKGAVA